MKRIANASLTLRALARLLHYPDAALRADLADVREVLHAEAALSPDRLNELDALIEQISQAEPLLAEARYVDLFDRGHASSLHLFEHVHGDSRDRGPAMVDLALTYAQRGLHLAEGELPDYLPVVLEFASTLEPHQAREFLDETTHILNQLFSALIARESRYAAVIGAVVELAGERPQAVSLPPEPALDESWQEPEVFGGCSAKGQSAPEQPQPVHLVRKHASLHNGVAQ